MGGVRHNQCVAVNKRLMISGLIVVSVLFTVACILKVTTGVFSTPEWHHIEETLRSISAAVVILAIVPANAFPICYARWFPFWKSTLGSALMTKAIGMALLIDVAVLYTIFGDDYFLREVVRIVVYALVVGGMYYQLVAIIGIRRADRMFAEQHKFDASQRQQSQHRGESAGDFEDRHTL